MGALSQSWSNKAIVWSILGHAKWSLWREPCHFHRAPFHQRPVLGPPVFITISVFAVGRCLCLVLLGLWANFHIPSLPPRRRKTSDPFWRMQLVSHVQFQVNLQSLMLRPREMFICVEVFLLLQTVLISPSFLSRMGGVRWRDGGDAITLTRWGRRKLAQRKNVPLVLCHF